MGYTHNSRQNQVHTHVVRLYSEQLITFKSSIDLRFHSEDCTKVLFVSWYMMYCITCTLLYSFHTVAGNCVLQSSPELLNDCLTVPLTEKKKGKNISLEFFL